MRNGAQDPHWPIVGRYGPLSLGLVSWSLGFGQLRVEFGRLSLIEPEFGWLSLSPGS